MMLWPSIVLALLIELWNNVVDSIYILFKVSMDVLKVRSMVLGGLSPFGNARVKEK